MKKNILVLLLTVGILILNGGCTSKESQQDEQTIENADIDKIESIDNSEVELSDGEAKLVDTAPAEKESVSPPTTDDASLDAALNESSTTETAPAAPTIDDTALTEAETTPNVSEAQLAPEAPVANETAPSDTASNVAETGSGITETQVVATEVQPTAVAKPATGSPLKKVASTSPYESKNGGWINTVYIARPGEKLSEISLKIFGSDKSKELKSIAENNFLKWRAPRGGDKIYYVSPNRPDDSARTILYYEDMGMVPETYIAKKGDNLKKVSKELLGYDGAWKEVWTSNSMESKSKLKEGEMIRYWKNGAEVMAMTPPSPPPQPVDMAATPPQSEPVPAPTTPPAPPEGAAVVAPSQAPEQTAQTSPPQPMDQGGLPPPPPESGASLPPPPTAESGTTDLAAAPPPPPAEEIPPPPPPPPVEETPSEPAANTAATTEGEKKDLDAAAEEEDTAAADTDLMMSIGALGILVALLAFVIIRKRKQKSQMSNLEMNA
jgi:hypothetical protein